MAEEKSGKKLFFQSILIVLLLIGFARVITSMKGLFLNLEMLGWVLILVLSFIGLVSYAKRWGERVLFFVFLVCLLNVIMVWFWFGTLYLILLLLSLVGFLVSIPGKEKSYCPQSSFEPPKEEIEKATKIVEVDEVRNEVKKELKKQKVEFSPGKYVASKRSNIYHEPKCDWAKKIKEERRLWFADEKEAQSKGYRKHSCVK